MEIRSYILWAIVGAAAATFLPRVLPLMVLSRLRLPDWATQWLKYVPVAVMAALVGQELLLSEGSLSLGGNYVKLLAAMPTFAVAFYTRSLLGTVGAGIVSMILLRLIL